MNICTVKVALLLLYAYEYAVAFVLYLSQQVNLSKILSSGSLLLIALTFMSTSESVVQ